MSDTKGRKAQMFKRAVESGRRFDSESKAVEPGRREETGCEEIKANEVEQMHQKIKSAFRAADAA